MTLIAIGGLWGGLAGIRVLELGAAAPGPVAWIAIVTLGALSSGSIGLPAAAATGVVSSLSALVDDGSWTGLRASGVSGRGLAPIVVLVGLLIGAVTFGWEGYAEPIARRNASRAVGAAIDVRLYPESVVMIGDLALRADRVDGGVAWGVFLASGGVVGHAEQATIDRDAAGTRVVLVRGEISGLDPRPWRVSFGRWRHELAVPSTGRIELDQRTNPELVAVIARSAAAGRATGYERAVLWKRWAHPLATALAPVVALPLGAASRPLGSLGALAIGYLVAVRVGDQLATGVGPAASLAGLAWMLVCGIVAWSRWRDR